MIRLVGLDLDGTVFNNKKEITQPVKNAIQQAIEAGIVVLPATGRPQSGIAEEFLRIPGVRYALSSNGAVVKDLITGNKLYECCISPEIAMEVLKILETKNCTLELYVEGEAYTSAWSAQRWDELIPDLYIRQYVKKTRIVVEDLKSWLAHTGKGVEKINISFGNVQEKLEAEAILKQRDDIFVTAGLPTNLEMNALGADKGEALLKMGEKLHIKKEEIAACGDSSNDFSMIQKVGVGVAMGNANAEIKKIAKIITGSNEEDGVAMFLQKVIEENRNELGERKIFKKT